MLRGRLVATLDPAKVTPEELGGYMTGAHDRGGCGMSRLRRPRAGAVRARRSPSSSAVVISSAVMAALRVNPLDVSSRSCSTSARPRAQQVTALVVIVNRAIPLFLAGLAVAVGFRMGLFNIGVEGQYRLATIMAAAVRRRGLPARAAARRPDHRGRDAGGRALGRDRRPS